MTVPQPIPVLELKKCVTICKDGHPLTTVGTVYSDGQITRHEGMFPHVFEGFHRRKFKIVTKEVSSWEGFFMVSNALLIIDLVLYSTLLLSLEKFSQMASFSTMDSASRSWSSWLRASTLREKLYFFLNSQHAMSLNDFVNCTRYDLYEVPDGKFGVADEFGNWNGMIGEVCQGVSTQLGLYYSIYWICSCSIWYTYSQLTLQLQVWPLQASEKQLLISPSHTGRSQVQYCLVTLATEQRSSHCWSLFIGLYGWQPLAMSLWQPYCYTWWPSWANRCTRSVTRWHHFGPVCGIAMEPSFNKVVISASVLYSQLLNVMHVFWWGKPGPHFTNSSTYYSVESSLEECTAE